MYTVSFFGHRKIFGHADVITKLQPVIKEIIKQHNNVLFLVGRNGDFDKITAQTVRYAIQDSPDKNCKLKLVLPYENAEYKNHLEDLQKVYDEIEICTESQKAYFKSAMQIRNQYMIDCSDMIVCFIERNTGGAYQSMLYAEKQHKKICRLAG